MSIYLVEGIDIAVLCAPMWTLVHEFQYTRTKLIQSLIIVSGLIVPHTVYCDVLSALFVGFDKTTISSQFLLPEGMMEFRKVVIPFSNLWMKSYGVTIQTKRLSHSTFGFSIVQNEIWYFCQILTLATSGGEGVKN